VGEGAEYRIRGGTLVFDDRKERAKLTLHDADSNVSFPTYEDKLPLTRELKKFTQAVRTRQRDPFQLEAGVAVKMIAAAE
jgi:hypothetical protein